MKLKYFVLIVLLSVITLSCSRSASVQFSNAYFQSGEVNIPEMLQQTGLLPEFPPLIVSGPMHMVSEVTSTTLAGSKASQTSGLTDWKPDSDERIGIFCNNSTKTSWAYYKTGGYTESKPVEIDFHILEWKPSGDEQIPMRYYYGLANYTTHAWEWHGPYLQDPKSFKGEINKFVLNSEALRDRYLSLNGVFSYVVVASNIGMSNPPADGKVGVNFGKAATENDTAAKTTIPINSQLENAESETPPLSKSRASLSQASVKLTWNHYCSKIPVDDATEYYIWRQHEDEEKPSLLATKPAPTGKPGDVVDMQFVDNDNLTENKAYKYFLQAHNSAGSTPLSFAREVVVPAIARWHTSVVRQTANNYTDNALSRVVKPYNGSFYLMPSIVCRNSKTNDFLYFEANRRYPIDEKDWIEHKITDGNTQKVGYGCSVITPNSANSGPHIAHFTDKNVLTYSHGSFDKGKQQYGWETFPLAISDPLVELSTSIALYSTSYPVIAYHKKSGTIEQLAIAVAKQSNPTDSTKFENVNLLESVGDKDVRPSIIIRSNGLPVLAFYNANMGMVNLLTWTKFNPMKPSDFVSNQYEILTFESGGSGIGKSPDLALCKGDLLYVSYINGSKNGVKCGLSSLVNFLNESDFSFTLLEPTVDFTFSALAVNNGAEPFIGNITAGVSVPKVKRSTEPFPKLSADWSKNEEIEPNVVTSTNLSVLSSNSEPWVSYTNNTNERLMFAGYYAKPTKPATPALPFASSNQVDGVYISWDPSENADGYYIYRGYRNKPIATVDALEGTDYIDTEVPNFEPWVYYIQAYNEAGVSGMSSYIGRKFDGVASPTDVFASDGDYDDKIKIGWDPPSIGPKPDGYMVQRSDDGGKNWNTINTTTLTESEDIVDLDKNTERVKRYFYQVLATLKGKSDSSPSLSDSGFANHVWQTYSVVDTLGDVNINQIISSMPIVKFNGKPVFLYLYSKSESSFINIAYGKIEKPLLQTDWETYEVLNTSSFVSDITGLSLAIVNGKLAIAFGSIDLYYGYANNSKPLIPNDWSFHKAVLNTAGSGLGENCSLAEIQGKPAIAFQGYDKADSNKTYLLYAYGLKVEPKDTTGWVYEELKSAILDPGKTVAPSMIQFNNQPAIAYQATSTYSKSSDYIKYFYRQSDLSSFYFDLTDGFYNCSNPNQKLLNGYPAVSYRATNGLEFIYTISGKPDVNSWIKCSVGNDWDYSGYFSSLDTELNVPAMSSMGKDETSTNIYLKYSISSSGLPNNDNWMHMTVDVNPSQLSHTGLFMGLSKPVILWYDWTDPLNGKIKCAYAE